MIGMSIVPERKRDRSGSRLPNQPHHIGDLFVAAGNPAVRPAEVEAPVRSEHGSCRLSFRLAPLRRAIRPQLASGEIAQTDRKMKRCVQRDAAAEPDLDVVWMWAEDKEIDGAR